MTNTKLIRHNSRRILAKGGKVILRISLIAVCISIFTLKAGFCSYEQSVFDQWSREFRLTPGEPRENPFSINQEQLDLVIKNGFIHALHYPVEVTGLLIPYDPMLHLLEENPSNPLRRLLSRITNQIAGFSTEEEFYEWLGLNPYNPPDSDGIYRIPYPGGGSNPPSYPVGATIMETEKGRGLTFSCAACHSASLFGRTVMGLPNKKSRSNQLFVKAKQTVPFIPSYFFQRSTQATNDEREMFRETKQNLRSVGAIKPQVLGLDTSLPQVALSLSRRNDDAEASKSHFYETFPRANPLEYIVADSKPGVWWTLKYKNRWLSDGSIVEGNPILTNFLWNEIGRGTDLNELKMWMKENPEVIKELTTAAFSTRPPLWGDFFDARETIDLAAAKRGEKIFNQSCMGCHGRYKKNWSLDNSDELSFEEKVKTARVFYHDKTPVKNVGTDPMRWKGMNYFAENLNRLEISKWMKTIVEPQEGYVPPPLDGIWARYPYFHNNSIPNLCALLTPPAERPRFFVQGPSENIEKDYDQNCIGYPTGEDIPHGWWDDREAIVDTRKSGLSNRGHYKMMLDDRGQEKYSQEQKKDLLEFLKTL